MRAFSFAIGVDGLAIEDQKEVYMSEGARETERFYWVKVKFPPEDERSGAGQAVWRVAGDTPEIVERKLRKRYPEGSIRIRVLREAQEGERTP